MSQSTSLDDVLGDLKAIVEAIVDRESGGDASYDAVQAGLPELSLHILTYIRFLENEGYVVYDRVADIIRVTQDARDAVADPSVWRDQAQTSFADHIDESGIGDLSSEVDGILDGLEIGLDGPSDDDDYDDSEMGTAVFDPPNESTHADTPPPAPNAEPDSDTSPEQETMNQNDSFASRRLSTSSGSSLGSSQGSKTAASSSGLYERVEEIGTGGIGTVFKGRQVKLDRDVAIKEIREIFDVFAGVQRSDIVERFTEIVQRQASLGHPNIIQVIDVDTQSEFPYVVLQYAPNGNLRRLIETDERPPLQVALKYFLQILHALNTAHDAEIYHGGIKPENVVLDVAGNALLTDFGISAVADLDTNKANQVFVGVGTVAYMSPEQFRDPNSSSAKSDIYSLGIMLYEMLTGKVPGRRSPMPSSFFPDIPRKLDDIFDKMSMDDPDDRYSSIDEILKDVYSSKEIMKILDKRGGFVFLRDPLVHGAVGLVAGGGAEGDDEDYEFDDDVVEESDVDEVDGDADDFDEPVEDGEVLDKLNKYSEMFDDEDDEDEDDSDAEDSDAEEDSEAEEESDEDDSDADEDDDSEAEEDDEE